MIKRSWQGDIHRVMIVLSKHHGKPVQTGLREVSVSEFFAIGEIDGAGTKFRESGSCSVWQNHGKFDIFAERDERIYGQSRRPISRVHSW